MPNGLTSSASQAAQSVIRNHYPIWQCEANQSEFTSTQTLETSPSDFRNMMPGNESSRPLSLGLLDAHRIPAPRLRKASPLKRRARCRLCCCCRRLLLLLLLLLLLVLCCSAAALSTEEFHGVGGSQRLPRGRCVAPWFRAAEPATWRCVGRAFQHTTCR